MNFRSKEPVYAHQGTCNYEELKELYRVLDRWQLVNVVSCDHSRSRWSNMILTKIIERPTSEGRFEVELEFHQVEESGDTLYLGSQSFELRDSNGAVKP